MSISNSDDVIDSRDVIARIEDLASYRLDLTNSVEGLEEQLAELQAAGLPTQGTELELRDARQHLSAWTNDEEGQELAALEKLAADGERADDWHHGETLVRDSYFRDYAEQLAIDCASSKEEASILEGSTSGKPWPFTFMTIDWEAAAEALQADYFDVDFGGVTYWIRG